MLMADDLDKQIARAKRNAQAKMSRIKKQQRYDIANTTNNPIRGDDSSMTRRQKQSYLKQLNKFNSRSTRFYVDARGKALSARKWEAYKRAEARANAFVRSDMAKYAKIRNPNGQTIGEWISAMRPKAVKLFVNPSGSNMHEIDRKPTAINGEKALEKLTKTQIEKANTTKYQRKVATGRKQLEKMADAFGDKKMIELAKALTDEQFKVLWNYTDFANAVSLEYSVYMQSLVDEKSFNANAMENASNKAHEYLKWASKIL
jgi:hypothetical protein